VVAMTIFVGIVVGHTIVRSEPGLWPRRSAQHGLWEKVLFL